MCPFYTYYNNVNHTNTFEVPAVKLPKKYCEHKLNEIVCGETRTGVGCGKSDNNYT